MDNKTLDKLITESLNEMYAQGKSPSINNEWNKFQQENAVIDRGINKSGMRWNRAIVSIAALVAVGFLCIFFVSKNIYSDISSNEAFLGWLFTDNKDVKEPQKDSLIYIPDGMVLDTKNTVVNSDGSESIKYVNEENNNQILFSCIKKDGSLSYSPILEGEYKQEYKANDIAFNIFEGQDHGETFYSVEWSIKDKYFYIKTNITFDEVIKIINKQSENIN